MLTFRSVTWKNFLSTGDNPITVRLDQSPTTLIIGANGSGKSTMLDALCFGLFGKPHRDVKNPQLINSINGKNCEVQVEFTIGQDSYRVIRGYKPSTFEIWKNSVLLNQESHSRDYQELLETGILKMNRKSFNQIVVLGAGDFVPFMQMPIWDRRGVVEELLDISVFSSMNTLIKEKLAKSRESLKDTESQIALAREKVSLQSNHLAELRRIADESSESIRREVESLEAEVRERNQELQVMDTEYETKHESIEKRLSEAMLKQRRFDGFTDQIMKNRDRVQTEHDFYQKNERCPTCEQDISDQMKRARIDSTSRKLREFQEGLSQLDASTKAHRDVIRQAQAASAEMKRIHVSSIALRASIEELQNRIRQLNAKLSSSAQTVDTIKVEGELQASQAEHTRLIETRISQVEHRAYLDAIQEMLRDGGIKAKIIKQYVPIMNKFINQYLSVLDFFVSFTLDDSFNETIRSRHRDDFSYSSFSEGEKMRINLAILFTWRQIAKLKNHNATNLLILDETFDSSLDGDGVDNLLKILNTLANTNVFVITHKPDVMVDRMNSKLEFVKVGNFSALKT